MTSQDTARKKTFTLAEANAALPLVRAIVEDLRQLANQVVQRRERLAMLRPQRDRRPGDPYQEELDQIQQELEEDTRRLQGYVQELRDLGVEPKSATQGLVDFPAVLDGRPVFLCWKLGEPEILYYHDRDAGFRGRRPLKERREQSSRRTGGPGEDPSPSAE
ncbi:MAG TPA: DUF2203 family protein [Planctomycetaceae bacterium]|nr:DUF2203 family protein [Planctomycetaceae bacterium]